MGSKKFKGKQCAYCGVEGISRDGEHVLARSFFLDEDKENLPKVPSCRACNSLKELLEDYALAVCTLGSRNEGTKEFIENFFERRSKKRRKLYSELISTMRPTLERTSGGLILEGGQLNIDPHKIITLVNLIVRGLYFLHQSKALPKDAVLHNKMFRPDDAAVITDGIMRAFGSDLKMVKDNIGRGTLIYEGAISNVIEGASFWRINVMRGAVLGSPEYAPGLALRSMYVLSFPSSMQKLPF